jgi:hypothetical protein
MQILHNLGAIFFGCIVMGRQTCIGNHGGNEYALVCPTTTMGAYVNVTSHYEKWLTEVNTDLTTHSRRAGDPPPCTP